MWKIRWDLLNKSYAFKYWPENTVNSILEHDLASTSLKICKKIVNSWYLHKNCNIKAHQWSKKPILYILHELEQCISARACLNVETARWMVFYSSIAISWCGISRNPRFPAFCRQYELSWPCRSKFCSCLIPEIAGFLWGKWFGQLSVFEWKAWDNRVFVIFYQKRMDFLFETSCVVEYQPYTKLSYSRSYSPGYHCQSLAIWESLTYSLLPLQAWTITGMEIYISFVKSFIFIISTIQTIVPIIIMSLFCAKFTAKVWITRNIASTFCSFFKSLKFLIFRLPWNFNSKIL